MSRFDCINEGSLQTIMLPGPVRGHVCQDIGSAHIPAPTFGSTYDLIWRHGDTADTYTSCL